jgi:voltage-gated potassium channel
VIFRLLLDLFRQKVGRAHSILDYKVLIAILAIICYATSGYMYFEIQANPDLKWADALWWSFVTMTTVGYGDFFPVTPGGRFLVGIPTMVFGISILGYLLSAVASYLIENKSKELRGMKAIKENDHILIVHFSHVDRILHLVKELRADSSTAHKPIVLVDHELEELPPELDEAGLRFVRGNPARKVTLEQANIHEATHAIVLSQNPQDSRSDDLNLAVCLTIESLRPEVVSIAECVDPESIDVLRRTGCDSVVCVSRFSLSLLVQELLDPGVQEIVEELTDVEGEQLFVQEIQEMASWKVEELQKWLAGEGALLIGVKWGESGEIQLNPAASTVLEAGDRAIFIGCTRPSVMKTV